MRFLALFLGTLFLAGAASPAPRKDAGDQALGRPTWTRPCAHTIELQAAKRSLAEGDRAGALDHLRRAAEIAAACEQNMEAEPESTAPVNAFAALAGAGGPIYWARSNETWPRI